MKTKKKNVFQKYKSDNEFQRMYREEKELLDVALKIAKTRKQKKLTQGELARKVGMHQSAIARIESGEENITLQTLIKITNALDKRVRVI